MRVYAGVDPVRKKRHDLVEVVPPGPNARREAEKILDRFRHEIAENHNPRTAATVDQLDDITRMPTDASSRVAPGPAWTAAAPSRGAPDLQIARRHVPMD